MHARSPSTNSGVLVVKLTERAGPGSGKKILGLLPRCFYAVDLSGSRAWLHHRNASAEEIEGAVVALSSSGGGGGKV